MHDWNAPGGRRKQTLKAQYKLQITINDENKYMAGGFAGAEPDIARNLMRRQY